MTKSSKTHRMNNKKSQDSHDNKKYTRLIFVMFYDSRPKLNTQNKYKKNKWLVSDSLFKRWGLFCVFQNINFIITLLCKWLQQLRILKMSKNPQCAHPYDSKLSKSHCWYADIHILIKIKLNIYPWEIHIIYIKT